MRHDAPVGEASLGRELPGHAEMGLVIRETGKGVARRAVRGAISFFRRDGVLAFLLICISLGWSLVAVSEGTQISRYDEWTYIDYARKVAVGHIPIQGEPLAAQSLEDWSCRGMEGGIRDVTPPECGSIYKGTPATSFMFYPSRFAACILSIVVRRKAVCQQRSA